LSRCALVACFVVGCSGGTAPAASGASDAAGDGPTCPAPPETGDLPCPVSAVFQAKCQHCHTIPKLPPPNNAPFPLRTYEDLIAPFGITNLRRWQRVAQVIEPGNFPHMPPPSQPQLMQSDFDTLHAWFMSCAPPLPEGTGCDVSEDGGAGSSTMPDANQIQGAGGAEDGFADNAQDAGASD
jgi:hypothetical protein